MWILRQVVVLLSLVSFLEAKTPNSTANPECNGMNTAAKHLKTTLKPIINQNAQCKPNPHCTGVKCVWSNGGFLEVDLHHCQDPVYYHFHLEYPGVGIPATNITMTQGDEKTLYEDKNTLSTVKIKVSKLERTDNIVTSTVILETCILLVCSSHTLMNNQKFCVRMQSCPGFNASAHQYKPCGHKPTGPHTKPPASASSGHIKTPPSPWHSSSAGHSKTQSSPWTSGSAASPSDGTYHHRKGGEGHGDDKKGLSTAAIIGICAAAVVVILVVVGVVIYWKKYHHGSRLRAAYYNDISMHDHLYEDFGPEVA